ncbi:DUF4192 family protein [Nocardia tengchongensis]|uniref:DUF4192 family protein n=1 Tax=Nocardia tengchongensis TaxID=2055889 RepID=UPI00360B46B3
MITHAEEITIGEYVAATPAFLNYWPEDETLVAVFLRHGRIVMVIDTDIDQDHANAAQSIARLAWREKVDSARIIAIAPYSRAGAAIMLADAITGKLAAYGVPVEGRAHTTELRRGGRYTDLDYAEDGIIPDPAATAAMVAAVADGRLILLGRAAATAQFTERPEPEADAFIRADIAALRPGHTATVLRDLSRAIAGNDYPTAELAANAAVLTLYRPARDAMLGLALIDTPAAAAVYTAIGNQLRGRARAHVLAMAAVLYYIDSQGIASYEATRAADDADRDDSPPLVKYMQAVHTMAMPVDYVRPLLAMGQIVATRYGVEVPEYDGRRK